MHFDVFNGDADGIIALVQLRLADPKSSTLITGVKRDIELLEKVSVENASSVTVLDVSMEKNTNALVNLLQKNIDVLYVDHHRSGDIPNNEHLTAIIDTDANTCTSLLVNDYLKGQYINWAITAAYGDNMIVAADALAEQQQLSSEQKEQLKSFGIYINYNGYGRTIDDLHFKPAVLFEILVNHADPFTLINEENSVYHQLAAAYKRDMQQAFDARVIVENTICKVLELPDQAWARRVSGVFGNELANQSPNKAHAVFTVNIDGTYTVSLRAPLLNKQGAGEYLFSVSNRGGGGLEQLVSINYLRK